VLICSDPAPSRGHYFFDRPFEGFDRIVNAIRGEELSYEGLNDYEAQCIDGNLEYFQLPFPRLKVVYNTMSNITSITSKVSTMCALQDGQLCIGFSDGNVKIWNPTTNDYEGRMLLYGYNEWVCEIIQLTDGRVCITAGQVIKIFNFSQKEGKWVKLKLQLKCCDNDWRPYKLVQYSTTQIISRIDCIVTSFQNLCKIQLWNLDRGESEKSFLIANRSTVFGILPNQKLWSSGFRGLVEIWDIDREEVSFRFDTQSHHMIQLASGNLCSCHYSGLICIWDYKTGQKINSFNLLYELKMNTHHLLLRDGRVCFSCDKPNENKIKNDIDDENSDDDNSNDNNSDDDNSDDIDDSCLLFYDIETGVCDQIIDADVFLFAQCIDGRLCCYADDYSEAGPSILFWSMQ
jgi:WD40 repeat protein